MNELRLCVRRLECFCLRRVFQMRMVASPLRSRRPATELGPLTAPEGSCHVADVADVLAVTLVHRYQLTCSRSTGESGQRDSAPLRHHPRWRTCGRNKGGGLESCE